MTFLPRWLLLVIPWTGCGAAPPPAPDVPAAVPAPAPVSTSSPSRPPPRLLADMALHSVWSVRPEDIGEQTDDPPRVFVVLGRDVEEGELAEGIRWHFDTWGTEWIVHPSPRDVSAETVTLVAAGAACVALPLRLVIFEEVSSSDAPENAPLRREAVEVGGCSFHPTHNGSGTPLAVGGVHPEATREDFHRDFSARDGARELRRRGFAEVRGRETHPLRGLRVDSHGSLEVVATERPAPDVWSGEARSNDADYGHTAYVLRDEGVVAQVPYFKGESLMRVGGREFLVLQSPALNITEYRVYEWTPIDLVPVLRVCAARPAEYLGAECHRPFTPN